MRPGASGIGRSEWFGSIFINTPFFKNHEIVFWSVIIVCLILGIIFLLYMVRE